MERGESPAVHDNNPPILPSLQNEPTDTNVSGEPWSEEVQSIKNEEVEIVKGPGEMHNSGENGGSLNSKEVGKLGIENIMSGQYGYHGTVTEELEELEVSTFNSKNITENSGGSSNGGAVESSIANEAALPITTGNRAGNCSNFQFSGSLEELEATELTAPFPKRIHSTSTIPQKPVMRVSFTSLAKATGKST